MSQGKSNGQIGRELYLSEDTVKTHARRLFRKLGVRDRAQAVAHGFRRGPRLLGRIRPLARPGPIIGPGRRRVTVSSATTFQPKVRRPRRYGAELSVSDS